MQGCVKELKHLKQQMSKLLCTFRINRKISSAEVNANIFILIVILLGVNGPLVRDLEKHF